MCTSKKPFHLDNLIASKFYGWDHHIIYVYVIKNTVDDNNNNNNNKVLALFTKYIAGFAAEALNYDYTASLEAS